MVPNNEWDPRLLTPICLHARGLSEFSEVSHLRRQRKEIEINAQTSKEVIRLSMVEYFWNFALVAQRQRIGTCPRSRKRCCLNRMKPLPVESVEEQLEGPGSQCAHKSIIIRYSPVFVCSYRPLDKSNCSLAVMKTENLTLQQQKVANCVVAESCFDRATCH